MPDFLDHSEPQMQLIEVLSLAPTPKERMVFEEDEVRFVLVPGQSLPYPLTGAVA